MNAWQTIVAALISALAGVLQTLINPILDRYKFIPLLGSIFAAADPVIKQNLPQMSSSDIYKVIRMAATDVAGGKLSQQEVDRLTELAFQKFDIRITANNVPIPQMDQASLSVQVSNAIDAYKAKQLEPSAIVLRPSLSKAAALLGTTPASAENTHPTP